MIPKTVTDSAFHLDGVLSYSPCESYTLDMYHDFENGEIDYLSLDQLRRIRAHYTLAIQEAKAKDSMHLVQLECEMRKATRMLNEKTI